MTEKKQVFRGLDGTGLKYIAMFSMLIDHAGAVLGNFWKFIPGGVRILRMAGRPAFMIYCFLLAEGFVHTSDRKKYGIRLTLFGLISEVVFDLAVFGRPFYWGYQNVYFELALGLLVLEGIEQSYRLGGAASVGRLLALAAGCLGAEIIRSDYGAAGIVIMAGFYYFRNRRTAETIWAAAAGFYESFSYTWGAGALAALPVFFYNGKRGKRENKYFFYWFYPAHLLVLFLIRSIIG